MASFSGMKSDGRRSGRILMGATVYETVRHFMLDQARFLASLDLDVHIFCSGPVPVDDQAHRTSSAPGVGLHEVTMSRAMSPLRDLRSLAQLIKLMRDVRPDAVIVGTPKAGLLGVLAARITGVRRRVYLVRGLRLEGLSGARRKVSVATERLTAHWATHVMAVSPSLRQELGKLRVVSIDKVIVLGAGASNGVDVEYFRPPTPVERLAARDVLGVTATETVIGFAGRLTRDKGVVELLDALEELRSNEHEVRLLVAGAPDPTDHLPPHAVEVLGSRWCSTVGHVGDMRKFYWSLDLFCLPSHREGMPNVNLEAAACGLPVVSTFATGCRDSVIPGETGLLVEPGDPGQLCSALKLIVQNPKLGTAMGLAGRRRVIATFSQQQVWENIAAFVADILRTGAPSEPDGNPTP